MVSFRSLPAIALSLALICALAACTCAQTPYTLPKLPYGYGALEPLVDTRTMTLHHDKHHNASVTALNAALARLSPSIRALPLTTLLAKVGSYPTSTLPANVSTAIRNSAGGHFNHAMFWPTLRSPYLDLDKHQPPNVRSPELNKAINKAFGSYSGLNKTLSVAASTLFGSGWAWVCYKPKTGLLAVVTTPNQDNPLMTSLVTPAQSCIPIVGIDVWEHAYYLLHQNVRNGWIKNWWEVVNWRRVSANYASAVKGDVGALWHY